MEKVEGQEDGLVESFDRRRLVPIDLIRMAVVDQITERKAMTDWALFLQPISDHYDQAERITLVMNNLSTHNPGAFYETFAPTIVKALRDRFNFICTPKHGSWLNMAEIELNVLIRQGLNRRIGDIDEMQTELAAWQHNRNNAQSPIDWQFMARMPELNSSAYTRQSKRDMILETLPELPFVTSRIIQHSACLVENHRRSILDRICRPVWELFVIGVSGTGELNPCFAGPGRQCLLYRAAGGH